MVGSRRMVSGKEDGKYHYSYGPALQLTASQFRKKTVSTLALKLNGVQGQKWKAGHGIVFHTVILQQA